MSKFNHLKIHIPFQVICKNIESSPFKSAFFEQNNLQFSGKSIKIKATGEGTL